MINLDTGNQKLSISIEKEISKLFKEQLGGSINFLSKPAILNITLPKKKKKKKKKRKKKKNQ